MSEILENKYEIFLRNTDIDLLAEIAAGGSSGGLDNYYTKTQANAITNALAARVTTLESSGGTDLTNYFTKNEVNSALATKQAINADLTAILALSPTNNDVIQRKANTWTNRTMTQVKQDMSLDNVNNTSDANKPISTLTQAALDLKAALTVTDSLDGRLDALEASGVTNLTFATTTNVDAATGKHFRLTLTGNTTLANPTNLVNGQRIVFELIQDGTGSRTVALGSKFAFGTDIAGYTASTEASKRDFVGAIYNSTTDKLYIIAVAKGY